MMGHRSKRFKLFTETNLEALVPTDNFYTEQTVGRGLRVDVPGHGDATDVRRAGGRDWQQHGTDGRGRRTATEHRETVENVMLDGGWRCKQNVRKRYLRRA